MAKITDLKFEINGVKYVVHVNCTSSGMFIAKYPDEVVNALGIYREVSKTKLSDLESEFNSAIKRYKESTRKEENFIFVRYKSSGKFKLRPDGGNLFSDCGSIYNVDYAYGEHHSGIAFDYKVVIKETIDGNVNWYNARLGKDILGATEEKYEQDKYYLYNGDRISGNIDDWKIIPYSKEAMITLDRVNENFRQLSELLFNFIEKDEKTIENILLNNTLLALTENK